MANLKAIMLPTEETAGLKETIRRDYLIASTTFIAVRALDMTSTAFGVSKLEEISAGLGFQVESNPMLRQVMERVGINQGAVLYGVASAAALLGVAYVVNKIGTGGNRGNLILLSFCGFTVGWSSNRLQCPLLFSLK